jgi:ribosomal protein S18 acetylase RimI-like enzyme
VCDERTRWAHGTAVRATRFPGYWDYNAVRVEGLPPARLNVPRLLDVVERHQAGLGHRKVEIEDATAGAALSPGLATLGWQIERLATMHHDGPLPPRPEGVAERPRDDAQALWVAWMGGEGWARDPAALDRLAADQRAVAGLLPGAAVTLMAGEAAYCVLRVDGTDAEIEDVYCTPPARGRGLGGSLVAEAIHRAHDAGARDVWIVADDEDRPKRLYERLGFRTAWIRHDAVRRPDPA